MEKCYCRNQVLITSVIAVSIFISDTASLTSYKTIKRNWQNLLFCWKQSQSIPGNRMDYIPNAVSPPSPPPSLSPPTSTLPPNPLLSLPKRAGMNPLLIYFVCVHVEVRRHLVPLWSPGLHLDCQAWQQAPLLKFIFNICFEMWDNVTSDLVP